MSGHSNHTTVAGTVSGTLLTLFANIHSEDLLKTAVLSLIGAVVSCVGRVTMDCQASEREVSWVLI